MASLLPLLPFFGFVLGLLTAGAGLLAYYRSSLKKEYAAERDFQHLKRNQEQLLQGLVHIDDGIAELKVEIVRLEGSLK